MLKKALDDQNRLAGPLQAWQFYDKLPATDQAYPAVRQSRDVYRHNWSVDQHNQIAKLWNQGKKSTAQDQLKQALKIWPESPLLLQLKAQMP